MAESKTECSKCRASILQLTADRNGGRCKACSTGPKLETVAEGMVLGMRLLFGVVFAGVFGGIGYGIGSLLGTVVRLLVAIPFALFGVVYGFFCVEINAVLRSMLPFMSDP